MDAGKRGEQIAETYLLSQGYEVIEKNFRYRGGEIDLIAREKANLVFVEVKSRRNQVYGLAREAVNESKQKNIYQAARVFLSKNNLFYGIIRFDVIEVYFDPEPRIEHIIAAFDGNDVEGY